MAASKMLFLDTGSPTMLLTPYIQFSTDNK